MIAVLVEVLIMLLVIVVCTAVAALIFPPGIAVVEVVLTSSVLDWVWDLYRRYADWWLQVESDSGGDSR